MNTDELKARLWLWGRAFGQRNRPEREERSPTGNSTLARFGRPAGYRGIAEGRNGRDRRTLMAVAAGGGVRILSAAFVDPVPCTATRSVKAPDYDPRFTAEVDRIQEAWLVLHRTDSAQAELVRVEYQEAGDHTDKAKLLGLTKRQYRYQLDRALVWLQGRIAA